MSKDMLIGGNRLCEKCNWVHSAGPCPEVSHIVVHPLETSYVSGNILPLTDRIRELECENKALLARAETAERERDEARHEIEVLRSYGNKDGTAQADEALASITHAQPKPRTCGECDFHGTVACRCGEPEYSDNAPKACFQPRAAQDLHGGFDAHVEREGEV